MCGPLVLIPSTTNKTHNYPPKYLSYKLHKKIAIKKQKLENLVEKNYWRENRLVIAKGWEEVIMGIYYWKIQNFFFGGKLHLWKDSDTTL